MANDPAALAKFDRLFVTSTLTELQFLTTIPTKNRVSTVRVSGKPVGNPATGPGLPKLWGDCLALFERLHLNTSYRRIAQTSSITFQEL